MVAGAIKICRWKYKNQAIRQSSEFVISWISRKKEFTRGAMERTLGFNLGQAEWWIKELRKKGIIKRTTRFEYKLGRGNRQAIYKYVE